MRLRSLLPEMILGVLSAPGPDALLPEALAALRDPIERHHPGQGEPAASLLASAAAAPRPLAARAPLLGASLCWSQGACRDAPPWELSLEVLILADGSSAARSLRVRWGLPWDDLPDSVRRSVIETGRARGRRELLVRGDLVGVR